MLKRSGESAILKGCIFGIPVVVMAWVAGEIRCRLAAEGSNPNVVNGFAGIVPALTAAVLLLSLGITALIIYPLEVSHYGRRDAIRWAAAGTIYGLLQQSVLTPIPSDFDFEVTSILRQIGGDLVWKALTLVPAYLLVFPLFSLVQNWLRGSRRG